MAQEFVVLQCCQCRTYQVQQSKKATKWLCKMCNQKQSFKQFFGRGSAKDCRLAVQTLNRQRLEEPAIEGVFIGANDSNTNINDSEILDLILAKEDNCDSSDDTSDPKKKRMSTEEVDENIESNGFESTKNFQNSWNNFNLKVGRRVSRCSQFSSMAAVDDHKSADPILNGLYPHGFDAILDARKLEAINDRVCGRTDNTVGRVSKWSQFAK